MQVIATQKCTSTYMEQTFTEPKEVDTQSMVDANLSSEWILVFDETHNWNEDFCFFQRRVTLK